MKKAISVLLLGLALLGLIACGTTEKAEAVIPSPESTAVPEPAEAPIEEPTPAPVEESTPPPTEEAEAAPEEEPHSDTLVIVFSATGNTMVAHEPASGTELVANSAGVWVLWLQARLPRSSSSALRASWWRSSS